LKLTMDSINTGIKMLDLAALYVSSHRNGLSKLCSSNEKHALGFARDTLTKQLVTLRNHVTDPETRENKNLVNSGITICREYFLYMYKLISLQWESLLTEYTNQNMLNESLYLLVTSERNEIEDELKSLYDHSTDKISRIKAFIFRFLVARSLFENALPMLGISANEKHREQLLRTIIFQPEFKQAGISILSFFSEIVTRKYPNLDVGIRIEQEGNKVTLIIETPSGEIEKIEQEFGNYGLVVTGKMEADQYLSNPVDAMLLKYKLEIANLELRQTRELLYSEREGYSKRIESLEDQIGFMRKIFDKSQYENEQTTAVLRELAASNSGEIKTVLFRIIDLLEQDSILGREELQAQLTTLAQHSPTIIDKLNELFIRGSIQGAAGNYLYAALNAVSKLF
jgi:hypothetical protein